MCLASYGAVFEEMGPILHTIGTLGRMIIYGSLP
jgi:hypothetical protein